jgi:hypothetical protein
MIGIANSQKGFLETDVDYLKPFIESSHNVIRAYAQAEEHKALVNTLEQKVEERTKSLLEANQRLEQANQRVLKASALRLQHFACMSHEIRTVRIRARYFVSSGMSLYVCTQTLFSNSLYHISVRLYNKTQPLNVSRIFPPCRQSCVLFHRKLEN